MEVHQYGKRAEERKTERRAKGTRKTGTERNQDYKAKARYTGFVVRQGDSPGTAAATQVKKGKRGKKCWRRGGGPAVCVSSAAVDRSDDRARRRCD
jgi:hypothetical protein